MKAKAIKAAASFLANPFFLGWLRRKKIRKQLVTILCLHRVSDENSITWPPLPIQVFDRLCFHWSKNYSVISFADLKKDHEKPLLILSFDDGYLDFYEHAWPILRKYGLKANMNIVSSCASGTNVIWTQRLNNAFDVLWNKGIRKSMLLPNGSAIEPGMNSQQFINVNLEVFHYLCGFESVERARLMNEIVRIFEITENPTPYMNWDQIRKLSLEGLEIGGHTMTHDILATIKNPDLLRRELVDSKKIIEEETGSKLKVLAFPNGFTTPEVNRIAFEAGYEYLVTVDNDFFPAGMIGQKNVLPRILIHHTGYAENVLNTENFFTRIKSKLK